MSLTPAPILFQPLLKTRVWGGRTLERLGKTLPAGAKIGESWELADLPASIHGGRNVIASPPLLAGRTLRAAMQDPSLRRQIMGIASFTAEGGFPVLIKYLDARENLSVQVHPSPAYARSHPEAHVKSEAWVVIDAEPDAVIYKGLKPGVTRAVFADHLRSGNIVDDLIAVPVKPGDCHYLPSGTCHALGAGIVAAEVQTPSDTTFRVYDWGRPAAAGRELHIDQALECIDFEAQPQSSAPSPEPDKRNGLKRTPLVQTEFFEIDRVDADASRECEIDVHGRPQAWMLVAGRGFLAGDFSPTVDLRPGMTILIPAAARGWRARFSQPSWMLQVRLPSTPSPTSA